MKSRWDNEEAARFEEDPLQMRVYTSRLIGGDEDLVLHGGGNTSVKHTVDDLFGDPVDVLYVKGSGWDLVSIEAAGFAPVRMDVLQRMATLGAISDTDMVNQQRAAMIDPGAPNPSVEAILHGLIPLTFVDHTHADAVIVITNTPGGRDRIREIAGIGERFQLRVVAVGVEAPEQLEALTTLGEMDMQGYLLAPPVSIDEFHQLLSRPHSPDELEM